MKQKISLKAIPSRPLLFALIAADLMFLLLHILNLLPNEIFPLFDESNFSISQDGGSGESFQYVKLLWITTIFFWLVFHHHRFGLVGFALLFAFFLLDDMIQIHEKLGDLAAAPFTNLAALSTFSNLQADDFGELIVTGLLGLVFFPVIFLLYRRADGALRQVFQVILAMLAIFLFFGIGMDIINGFINSNVVRYLFLFIEDGGEMLVTSIICWYAWTLVGDFNRRGGDALETR